MLPGGQRSAYELFVIFLQSVAPEALHFLFSLFLLRWVPTHDVVSVKSLFLIAATGFQKVP